MRVNHCSYSSAGKPIDPHGVGHRGARLGVDDEPRSPANSASLLLL